MRAAVITAGRLSDGTDATGDVISGASEITGAVVRHRVVGAVAGQTYRLQCRITTVGNNVREREIDVAVIEV